MNQAFWQLWLQYSQRVTYLFKQWNRKEWVEAHLVFITHEVEESRLGEPYHSFQTYLA